MKAIIGFAKTTLVGGFLFLVPIVLVFVLVGKALQLTGEVLAPVARIIPAEAVAGIVVLDLLAVTAVVALCFAAGLFVRTRAGSALGDRLEHAVLGRVPGFALVKSITRGMMGLESGSEVSVALARIEDAWVLSFVLERHASGLFTVFIPSAPTPAVGSIYYLTEDRLKRLDVPVSAAVACIMRLGVGSRDLLEKEHQPPDK